MAKQYSHFNPRRPSFALFYHLFPPFSLRPSFFGQTPSFTFVVASSSLIMINVAQTMVDEDVGGQTAPGRATFQGSPPLHYGPKCKKTQKK